MARYAVECNRTASTTLAVGVLSSGGRQALIYDFIFGSEGAPTDSVILAQLQRSTGGAGTGTNLTPTRLDEASATSSTTVNENLTVNPTLTGGAIVLSVAMNQRSTFRWSASPGSEIYIASTFSEGITLMTPTSSAVAVTGTFQWSE